jgi:hypothetical protein
MGKFYKISEEKMIAIADRVRAMAGTTSKMTVDDVIYWLGRVLYIPQSSATSEFTVQLDVGPCTAAGIIPVYQKVTAESTFTLPMSGMFITTAVGELIE